MTTPSGQPPNHDPGDQSGWPPPPPPYQPGTGPQPTQAYGGQPGYGQPGYGQPYGETGGYPYGQPYGPVAPGYGAYGDPMAPYGYDPIGRPYSDKQKLVAGLLGIFLGAFGVGRFYTGHVGLGVAQLLVGVFTCFTVSSIWGLIDGILILVNGGTDAQGRPLRD
ncbi:MAG TPA: TM2 domain-containing protein [Pseudonocardiaceae bacterium]|nr:TM2 domain-containing protein [Pseudonocardiaceae bacterium]